MGKPLEGYLVERGTDTVLLQYDHKGTEIDSGWRLARVVRHYQTRMGDKTTSAVLVKDDPNGYERFAGGYWLAPDAGDLFRGEKAENVDEAGFREALRDAKSLASYWLEQDDEHEQMLEERSSADE